jgi:CMP-N-acetylneuraminic acid synthetase
VKVLGLIPARGGSRGLPMKNIRPLVGLPLIVHTVKFAKLCPQLARTIVSTDSPEIAETARAAGADVPFLRPAELARDDTPMWPVVRHALETAQKTDGGYDALMLLDPTTPCRLPEDVAGAAAALERDPKADGVLGVSQPEINPLWNCWQVKDGSLQAVFSDGDRYVRRQDVPTVYWVNASMYLWRARFIESTTTPWTNARLVPYEIPNFRAIHIDDIHEFDRAELLIRAGHIRLPWLTEANP